MQKIDLSSPAAQPNTAGATKNPNQTAQPQSTVDSSRRLSDNQASQQTAASKSVKTTSSTGLSTSAGDTQKVETQNMKKVLKPLLIAVVVAVLAGVGTGYMFAKNARQAASGIPVDGTIQKVAGTEVKEGDVFGSADESTFKDTTEGYLTKAEADDEGTHLLLRPGGESQTVHLTSSVTDLDKLEGMEVQVWGETFKGQKAGWLMDVGRVKVNKVDGVSPIIE
jgi:hypothetical protein